MKYFWKIYFTFTVLFLVSFSFFGMRLIEMSFQRSLKNMLEEGERENRMYQLAFEMNLTSLDEIYWEESAIPVTAASVVQNLADPDSIYRVYGSGQALLYESGENNLTGDVLQELAKQQTSGYEVLKDVDMDDMGASSAKQQTSGYEVLKDGDAVWLLYACRSDWNGSVYYLENLKNISEIYEAREQYYDGYTLMMAVLTVIITVLVYVLTRFLTKPISELSRITRGFSGGDYMARASEKGGGEIAELAGNFNEMADTIQEKMDELTMQARRQEDFTASFAHELKTPLTSIIGYADMLRTVECTQEERRDAVEYIFRQGKRLESLSFKLLELIVTGRQEKEFCSISVPETVKDAVDVTLAGCGEKDIRLDVHLQDGRISGDRDLMVSALTNLIDNSRKAVAKHGVIRIYGKQRADGKYALLISDNGCGMEEEEVKRITEPFYMVDKSRARKEGGAGLGMALVSRILKLHHARWRIFSAPKKGTAVVIVFSGGEEQADVTEFSSKDE